MLSNQHGVEKLDKDSKELYEKIKDVVGYDEIDQLQQQFMNCKSDECKTAVYNDYYQKEQEAGQKLVDLYKSGELTKADFEQLVTWYNDLMLDGVEQAKADAGSNRSLWDIYDASSMGMTPAALISNPYLAEIRALILLDQWRAAGLSELEIQEKFLKDGVLGAFGSGPDVNAIVHKIRNNDLSLEDGLALATMAAYGKIVNDANKGKVLGSDYKLSSGQTVGEFEKSLSNLPPGERVAIVKTTVNSFVKENGWVKDNKISTMNNRDVYKGKDGYLYAVDSQHGRFEKINPKNGQHLGEYDLGGNLIPNSLDKSGGHNLKVK